MVAKLVFPTLLGFPAPHSGALHLRHSQMGPSLPPALVPALLSRGTGVRVQPALYAQVASTLSTSPPGRAHFLIAGDCPPLRSSFRAFLGQL